MSRRREAPHPAEYNSDETRHAMDTGMGCSSLKDPIFQSAFMPHHCFEKKKETIIVYIITGEAKTGSVSRWRRRAVGLE
jgi:hypothetical protein